ncbi:MAG: hypothetical protein OSJ65_01460 [Bacilli bacterium]|nr:hypothetical protein [Bacilli bacterium]
MITLIYVKVLINVDIKVVNMKHKNNHDFDIQFERVSDWKEIVNILEEMK